MNEFTILSILLMTLGFITDDTIINGDIRAFIGYGIITIVLLNITVNIVIFIYVTLKEI
jgi:hypothetical protein